MNDSSAVQLKGPREALSQFVAEVRRDLESSHTRLSAANTADQLVEVATETHKTLMGHGQTMGEFVQIVRDWRHDTI
jgi:hypothetical protein